MGPHQPPQPPSSPPAHSSPRYPHCLAPPHVSFSVPSIYRYKYRPSLESNSAYLPSCDDPAQRLGSSNSLVCIAQRGMGLLRASFGDLGGAIFAGLLSSFSLIPSPWRWIEEECMLCCRFACGRSQAHQDFEHNIKRSFVQCVLSVTAA